MNTCLPKSSNGDSWDRVTFLASPADETIADAYAARASQQTAEMKILTDLFLDQKIQTKKIIDDALPIVDVIRRYIHDIRVAVLANGHSADVAMKSQHQLSCEILTGLRSINRSLQKPKPKKKTRRTK